jgi:TRAP-type C4-dicarboxylate transport system permease small subunit
MEQPMFLMYAAIVVGFIVLRLALIAATFRDGNNELFAQLDEEDLQEINAYGDPQGARRIVLKRKMSASALPGLTTLALLGALYICVVTSVQASLTVYTLVLVLIAFGFTVLRVFNAAMRLRKLKSRVSPVRSR